MCLMAELLLLMFFWAPVYSNTVIIGEVGEDVILPCSVEYEEEFSYNTLNLIWKAEHIHVHNFLYGNFQEKLQDKIFKGKTQLFYAEFPKGNLSLLLKNIQTSDAGIYTCIVFILKHIYRMKIELVVQDHIPEKAYGFPNESSVVNVSVGVLVVCVVMGFTAFLRRRKRSRGRNGIPHQGSSKDATKYKSQPTSKIKKNN